MNMGLLNAGRHAERVFDVVRGGFVQEGNDVVVRSWRRCLDEYRLHPDRPHDLRALAAGAFDERVTREATLLDCARHEMATLYQQLADSESAVVLTDTDGVILHMVASTAFAEEVAPLGLRPGVSWSENEAGTNGMGTCLASASPVAVRREDHFFTRYTGLTCSAVPVFDPSGDLAAVLDVSSRSSLAQQHLLVLLGMTARMIENRLIDQRFRHAHPLHFHSRPEFVYTLHEGRLAVSDDGRVLAANRSALFQLGLQSVADIRNRRIEDLFQTTQDDLLNRSSLSSFHPVVTYRANAAHRFFAVMRRPALDARAVGGIAAGALLSPAEAWAAAQGTTHAAAPAMSGARAAGTRPAAGRGATPATPSAAPASNGTFTDPTLARHLVLARRVIARQTPVLLCGETGSGKEVFARAVHDGSPHASGTFVAVNCASLPESLIESELFGYRAGAFTGAQRTGRRGKIAQADGGTLFLDEIGDMPLELQARLLRVLEERQVTPLGGEETVSVDFQLLSASHRNLLELVEQGRFREDLYYRLAGVEVRLPALRERSDRAELIRSLLVAEGGAEATLSTDAEQLLMTYAWPGNVRQLRHALRSACALADGALIEVEHLPMALQNAAQQAHAAAQAVLGGARLGTPSALSSASGFAMGTGPLGAGALAGLDGAASPAPGSAPGSLPSMAPFAGVVSADEPHLQLNPILANERQVMLKMLEHHRWNVSNVAKAFDVSRNTLYRRLHKLHIRISHAE